MRFIANKKFVRSAAIFVAVLMVSLLCLATDGHAQMTTSTIVRGSPNPSGLGQSVR